MVTVAYFFDSNIYVFRIAGLFILAVPFYHLLFFSRWFLKTGALFLLAIAVAIYYLATRKMQADVMFLEVKHKIMSTEENNKVNRHQLVIGVTSNDEASCFPVEIIAYHHKVLDTVGGIPILVTYCSVCRSGRVYSPVVNGNLQKFRLVGMDQFNAMLEDSASRTWWRQENGEAVAGPLKGMHLTEIPSQQMTLQAWLTEHPATTIMQADPDFIKEYASLEGFGEGSISNNLEGTSHASWQSKSWVIGIVSGQQARAYDWIGLKSELLINDTLDNTPLLIAIERDMMSFHVWDRRVDGQTLEFIKKDSSNFFYDLATGSAWNYSGVCIAGTLTGNRLKNISAYQEFWHSWRTFHPGTTRYEIH